MTKSDEWVEVVMGLVADACAASVDWFTCEDRGNEEGMSEANARGEQAAAKIREMLEERELLFAHVGCM